MQPRVQGGENSWENLVCACVKCNARKGGRTPRQAGMRLIRRPVQPSRNPAITLRLGAARYESWKAFLDEAYWTVELQTERCEHRSTGPGRRGGVNTPIPGLRPVLFANS